LPSAKSTSVDGHSAERGLDPITEVYTVVVKLASIFQKRGAIGVATSASGRSVRSREREAENFKKQAGRWLREQRRKAGLSQMDLADRLGLRYYTFVSQIENGYGRVPSHSMAEWARALGIRPRSFARTLLGYYDQELYRVLFEE
jgi:ribosome-binding protein aMBF1 (putative translation factor)